MTYHIPRGPLGAPFLYEIPMNTAPFTKVSVIYDPKGRRYDRAPWVVRTPFGEAIRKRSYAIVKAYCYAQGWLPTIEQSETGNQS